MLSAFEKNSSLLPAKPLVLLDIDGVCLPFKEATGDAKKIYADFSEYLVDFKLIKRIQELVSLPGVEVVWCSAWQESSELIGEAFELDPAPTGYIDLSRCSLKNSRWATTYSKTTWKLSAIDALDLNRPIIWIDDDLFEDTKIWKDSLDNQVLLCHTDPNLGFTAEQLQEIKDFISSL